MLCPGSEILAVHLPRDIAAPSCALPPVAPGRAFRGGLSREAIRTALAQAGDNRSLAARLLGVDRRTLYRNMARLDMD